MNLLNKNYHLEDVFKEYTQYTKNKEPYRSSSFSCNLTYRFKKYKLDDFLPLIKETDAKPYTNIYKFNETEKNIISLFMSCSTIRQNKSKDCFDEKVLCPFPRTNQNCNAKLSDLYKYMKKLIHHIEENFADDTEKTPIENILPQINKIELDNIFYKIKLSVRLKNILERLITSIYFQDKFNTTIFEYMLTRLEGFADELDIISNIDEENSCNDSSTYNSADVSIAATLGDILAYNNFLKRNKNFDNENNLSKLYLILRKKENIPSEIERPKHRSLSNPRFYQPRPKQMQNYMYYIDNTIENMVTDCLGIANETMTFENYCVKYGINHSAKSPKHYRLETKLFETYIKPRLKEIVFEKINSKELISEIKEKIHNKLYAAKKDTEQLIREDKYQISSVLDMLLFKPFIHFHDLDMEELCKKAKDNPVY